MHKESTEEYKLSDKQWLILRGGDYVEFPFFQYICVV